MIIWQVGLKLSDLKREIDISVYLHRHVIEALTMFPSTARDYKLGGLGLVFEVDQRLQNCFENRINEAKVKALIQREFKDPLHEFDRSEMGYIKIGALPICWHITTVNKQTGKPESFRYLKQCGKHLAYKVTVYKAIDFAKINVLEK